MSFVTSLMTRTMFTSFHSLKRFFNSFRDFCHKNRQNRRLFTNGGQNEIKDMNKTQEIYKEMEFLRYSCWESVPKDLSEKDLKELFFAENAIQRQKLFLIFARRERQREERHEKSGEKPPKVEKEMDLKLFSEDGVEYGLWRNSLISRIRWSSVRKLSEKRLQWTTLFGQKLIIDFSFQPKVTETRLLVREMAEAVALNRISRQPFDICVRIPEKQIFDRILALWKNSDHYLTKDVVPNDAILILPNADRVLQSLPKTQTLVIPALAPRVPSHVIRALFPPNISVARLPIKENVLWSRGANTRLSLREIIGVLHAFSDCESDWRKAVEVGVDPKRRKSKADVLREEIERKNKQ